MTDPLELAVSARAAGIALTLEACISSAALRCVAAATGSGAESSDTSDDIHSVDLQRLLNSMQQTLARELEALQRNLAGQSLEIIPDQVRGSMNTGLEVSMRVARHGHGLIALVVKRNGRVDESYRPVPVDVALEAAGYLIRGSEPPRALFSCRGKLAP